MKAIEIMGAVDERRLLRARVPESLPAGPVRLIVLLPDEDDAGVAWSRGLSREWEDDLGDPRQDLYSIADGQPLHAAR